MDIEKILRAEADESGNIPAAKISTIVSAIQREVGQNFVDRERYNQRVAEVQQLKDDMAKAEEAGMAAKQLQAKYEALRTEYKDYKTQQTRAAEREAKTAHFREILTAAGVPEKFHRSICEVSTAIIDGIQVDGDGKVVNSDKLAAEAKEHWGDFIPVITTTGAPTQPTALSNNAASGSSRTKDEILAIRDTQERQRAIAENHELFGF